MNYFADLHSHSYKFDQEERLSHLNTKKQLNDVSDRLEFALGEIEVVTKQIEREKAAFQKA